MNEDIDGGDCYKANADYILNLLMSKTDRKILQMYKLCHGLLRGAEGSVIEGEVGGHAWIGVNGDVVMDFSNGKQIVGRIEEVKYRIVKGSVRKYTPAQVRQKLLQYGHYGAWHDTDFIEKELQLKGVVVR
jgi:hypothetical protein